MSAATLASRRARSQGGATNPKAVGVTAVLTDRLLAVAEDNARLLRQAGVRWARDVGAPVRDGRALSLTVRDGWRGRAGYPYVRAAGCWLARTGSLPSQLPVEVDDGDGLLAAALGQLQDDADLVKLYMGRTRPRHLTLHRRRAC